MQPHGQTGFRRQLALYFSAQEFLTRLPVPGWIGHEPDRLARAARYFPLVGLVVGGAAGAVWYGASLAFPAPVAALLAVATMIVITGALHEDGFADCCDGLGGGASRDRALDIMRDSRIGVYAGAGLVLVIGLRGAALAGMTPLGGLAALLIAATTGRAAITMILARGTYARDDGAARGVAGGVTVAEAAIAIAIALGTGLLAGGAPGLMAVLLSLVAALVWLRYLDRRLGGYTGDGLGAAEQIGQVVTFLCLAGPS